MSNIYEYGKEPPQMPPSKFKTLVLWLLVAVLALAMIAPAFASETLTNVEIGFSPDQGATERLTSFIGEAKSSIRVAAYSFTSAPIAKALLDAHKRGIDVKVVLDKSQRTAKYSSYTFLANVGIPTRINTHYAIMHNKYIIVDGNSVELGSFNFTKAAEEKNAENFIILRNQPEIAKSYLNNWQKLWDESRG